MMCQLNYLLATEKGAINIKSPISNGGRQNMKNSHAGFKQIKVTKCPSYGF